MAYLRLFREFLAPESRRDSSENSLPNLVTQSVVLRILCLAPLIILAVYEALCINFIECNVISST